VHILSVEDINLDDPWAGFRLINEELTLFEPALAERRQIEVINKIDLVDCEFLQQLKDQAKQDKRDIFFISAVYGDGIEELQEAMWQLNDSLPRGEAFVRPRTLEELQLSKHLPSAESNVENLGEDSLDDDEDYSGIEVIGQRIAFSKDRNKLWIGRQKNQRLWRKPVA
jgi:Predicted GTPase